MALQGLRGQPDTAVGTIKVSECGLFAVSSSYNMGSAVGAMLSSKAVGYI